MARVGWDIPRTHGNVGHEVATSDVIRVSGAAMGGCVHAYPSITSRRRDNASASGAWDALSRIVGGGRAGCGRAGRVRVGGCEVGRGLTHVQPLCTAANHALAFCGELPEVGGQHRGRNNRAGHYGCEAVAGRRGQRRRVEGETVRSAWDSGLRTRAGATPRTRSRPQADPCHCLTSPRLCWVRIPITSQQPWVVKNNQSWRLPSSPPSRPREEMSATASGSWFAQAYWVVDGVILRPRGTRLAAKFGSRAAQGWSGWRCWTDDDCELLSPVRNRFRRGSRWASYALPSPI